MLFVNFGNRELRNEPSAYRVDVKLDLGADYDAERLIELGCGAVEELLRQARTHQVELGSVPIGGPEDPALAVTFAAVLQGFLGAPQSICFPRRRPGAPGERYYDLNEPVWPDERASEGVRLREHLRGTKPDLSRLPLPPKKHDLAFLCFAGAEVESHGRPALRVDVPIAIPPRSAPGSPGDEPYGWGVFSVATPFDHRDEVLRTFTAREVIVGLPDHAGLALTIAATWEHFYYDEPPLFGWLMGPPGQRRYDLRNVIDVLDARRRGESLRQRLAAEPVL
ncbi:MAG: hypothetical protein HY744_19025 [Deltaproteobacteria bacterium]|nr:hypothetical protein [Deltaproteobacteria bacterium]